MLCNICLPHNLLLICAVIIFILYISCRSPHTTATQHYDILSVLCIQTRIQVEAAMPTSSSLYHLYAILASLSPLCKTISWTTHALYIIHILCSIAHICTYTGLNKTCFVVVFYYLIIFCKNKKLRVTMQHMPSAYMLCCFTSLPCHLL